MPDATTYWAWAFELNGEFGGHCIHESLSGNCCVGDVLYTDKYNNEFIPV